MPTAAGTSVMASRRAVPRGSRPGDRRGQRPDGCCTRGGRDRLDRRDLARHRCLADGAHAQRFCVHRTVRPSGGWRGGAMGGGMVTDLDQLQADLLGQIDAATTPEAIETLRVAALGKSGSVTGLLKPLGGMTPEQRQVEGQRIHGLREAVTEAQTTRNARLEREAHDARKAGETLDITLPADLPPTGTIHPVSQELDELAEIFADLGFAVATGPEIEDDWYNFTALNIPET